jgi:hypothetical protein
MPAGIAALTSSALGAELVWHDFSKNFDKSWARFAHGGFFLWSNIVSSMTSGMGSLQDAKRVEAFFQHPDNESSLGSSARALQQALESVAAKESQVKRYKAEISSFLDLWKV